MHTFIQRLTATFSVIALAAVLVSCGGGSSGGGDDGDLATADRGTVTLLITDAPTAEFKKIYLTILKAELLCDDGRKELYSGTKTVDLLQLRDVTEIFSVSQVTAGICSKIRLTLESIKLVFKDSEDKEPVYAKLLGNGKLDLNPREDFYVDPEHPLSIQLDFDAEKSIHVKNKAEYNFRPVVFIKIIKDKFDTKLIRQRGIVDNKSADGEPEEFDLCLIEAEVQPVSLDEEDDSRNCVRVKTKDDLNDPTSIFDDEADPISFEELKDGEIATVVGRFSFEHYTATSKSDDNWSDDDNDRPHLVLVADVIWTGRKITQTVNIACSGVTDDEYENYELPVPDGDEACQPPAETRTVLQPGARIYDSEGNELDDSSIAEGVLNKVDAFEVIEGEKKGDLKAVLVMLGLDNPLNPLDQLTGIIVDVDIDFDNEHSNLMLMPDEEGAADRCVNFDNVQTEVFETSLDEENNIINFDQKSVFSLRNGQQANVFGTENNGCLDADTIIYEEPEEVI